MHPHSAGTRRWRSCGTKTTLAPRSTAGTPLRAQPAAHGAPTAVAPQLGCTLQRPMTRAVALRLAA
eukprot:6713048-Prymnesium_polylepis.1